MDSTIDHETAEELLRHDIYTPEELARLLDMSLYRIRHAAREGDLHATIVDHHVLCIRREDVLAWLRARAQRTP
ncbi:MAG TPA: helix-turn-helix domain-containing protein [Thermomicrobiales bacterium]